MQAAVALLDHDEPTTATADHERTHGRTRRASAPIDPGARYEVGAAIGRGGMGEVFAAYDVQIGREVAIKRLQPERTSPAALARFLREARIQGRLAHPAIPPVYELAHDDQDRPFFAMKKLDGVTLAEVLRAPDRFPAFAQQRMLGAFVDVCNAIELAHARGVIHRDLKPSNILLGEFGEVYVLDWGIARVLDEADSNDTSQIHDDATTSAGVTIGTPGYMAPEQIRGERDLDARADVYTLGCVLFEILSGRALHPRGRAGMHSALSGIEARPSMYRDDVPPELDEICRRATAACRDHRVGSARELGEAVQRYLDGDRDLARRQDLAHRHLAAACAAQARGDDETCRREAMREAGRALALDPTLVAAAELVGRLMIVPPTVTPRAVELELDAVDAHEARRQAKLAIAIYAAYLVLAPIFYALGIHDLAYLGAFAGLAALNVGLQLAATRYRSRALTGAVIVASVALVGALARMFTPFLVAPGVGAVTLMAFALNPEARESRVIVGSAILGTVTVIGVWLAELVGIVSPTIAVTDGAIILKSPLDGFGAFPTLPALCLFAFTLTIVAGSLAHAAARSERTSRRQLHLQAWQLRQLLSVPPLT
jgi:serine/threonine-protein kinase